MIRLIFFLMCLGFFISWFFKNRRLLPNVESLHSVDAIVPAFNEETCIALTIEDLLSNRYIRKVVCVNDGSTDNTGAILADLQRVHPGRLVLVEQTNTGKGGALMNGLRYVKTPYVFMTDADTRIPNNEGIGYLIAQLENGADAVGGIPASDLSGAGILPKMRASIKAPMIILKRCSQAIIGGAPFLISGSCGLFRTDILCQVGISNRTSVEDLDLTWTLVERGYKIAQSARCVVYAQESNGLRDEWKRWRRWIVGFTVCMRIHRRLLVSRFGFGTILPIAFIGLFGLMLFYVLPTILFFHSGGFHSLAEWIVSSNLLSRDFLPWWIFFSPSWAVVVMILALYSAKIHRDLSLVLYAPLSMVILLITLSVWLRYGIIGLIVGKEPVRIKPRRY